jgi:hypothetical protein
MLRCTADHLVQKPPSALAHPHTICMARMRTRFPSHIVGYRRHFDLAVANFCIAVLGVTESSRPALAHSLPLCRPPLIYNASETSSSSSTLPRAVLINSWPTGSPTEGSSSPPKPLSGGSKTGASQRWAAGTPTALETISDLFHTTTADDDTIAHTLAAQGMAVSTRQV